MVDGQRLLQFLRGLGFDFEGLEVGLGGLAVRSGGVGWGETGGGLLGLRSFLLGVEGF
jgi:hypothetical protein